MSQIDRFEKKWNWIKAEGQQIYVSMYTSRDQLAGLSVGNDDGVNWLRQDLNFDWNQGQFMY